MTDIKLKPPLLNALKTLKQQDFTVATLVEVYLAQPDSIHTDKKPAWQFVYRNMQRLMRAGVMMKDESQPGWPLYTVTVDLDHGVRQVAATKPAKPVIDSAQKTQSRNTSALDALQERLGQYQSDMLCAMGEAEEYRQVSEQWPELLNNASSLYHDSRERSAILLGKIRALETVIARHGE